jgi:hypothetical protein
MAALVLLCEDLSVTAICGTKSLSWKRGKKKKSTQKRNRAQDASSFHNKQQQEPFNPVFNRILPLSYQGGSRIELHVCCLWIPVLSQGVVCFHSVGLGCSWTFTVIISS